MSTRRKNAAGSNSRTPPPQNYKAFKEIPIDELRFDPRNPRLPTTIDGHDTEAVLKWMLKDASIIELMIAIGEKGYFPGEPILVTESEEVGIYDVIEGNRRLCAVKLLNNPGLAPTRRSSIETVSQEANFKPQVLPSIIYEDRSDILAYLGYKHITGVKEWDSLAKARYLNELRDGVTLLKPDEQFKSLARGIGSRADHVRRLLTAFAVYEVIAAENFFNFPLNEESIEFSILTTSLFYQNLYEFIGLKRNDDPDFKDIKMARLKELTEWIFVRGSDRKTRLGESRNLASLSAVVKNPKALDHFRSGYSLQDAEVFTGAPTEVFRNAIGSAKKFLLDANDTVHNVDKPSQGDSDSLLDIQKISKQVRTIVETKIHGEDDL
jgi:hypothetical protein